MFCIQAYNDKTMKKSQVYKCRKYFCDSHESDYNPQSGCPPTSKNNANTDHVQDIARDDRRKTGRNHVRNNNHTV